MKNDSMVLYFSDSTDRASVSARATIRLLYIVIQHALYIGRRIDSRKPHYVFDKGHRRMAARSHRSRDPAVTP